MIIADYFKMESNAKRFVEEQKANFPNAWWSWTGVYNNETGYIVIYTESDRDEDGWEWAEPTHKMLADGTIVPCQ